MVEKPITKAMFPISRDPPEGGTRQRQKSVWYCLRFPISRDPPEGGTIYTRLFISAQNYVSNF